MSYPGALYPGTTYPGEFAILDPSQALNADRPSGAPVALLDWFGDPARVVQSTDWVLDDRADSTNQLRVTTSLAEADGVKAEQEVIFKARRFTVSQVVRDRSQDRAVITADEAQAALADIVLIDFRPINRSLAGAMNDILSGTRWTIGEANGVRDGNADFDEITAMDALHFLARHQDAELSFDSLRRRVNITGSTGRTFEYVFTYGRQLLNIEKDVEQPTTTVIYPTMGSGDEEVALDPVEDYGYYLSQGLSLAEARARFRKEDHWAERDYEFAENMIRDAEKRLEEEAWPRITYTLTAQATLDVEGVDDFDLAELRLGDTVYVWDQEIDAKVSAEVTAVTTSSDQSQNELTLSTLPASLGDTVRGRGYFGDSGRPSSGGPRRSGPQPRPSMPIFEATTSYGVVEVRWNGQDHDGNYTTIPQRFGRLYPIVAPLEDGVVPSPFGDTAFTGSDIISRNGGTSTFGVTGHGEHAVWFQMEGWDLLTKSELSEPLVVDVPPVFNPGPLQDSLEDLNENRLPELQAELEDARDRLEQAEQDLASGMADRVAEIEYLRETRIPALQEALNTGLDDVYRDAQAYAEAQADDAVNRAAADAQTEYDRLQEIAERALSRAGDNVLEDPSFETDHWFNTSWSAGYAASVSSLSRTGDQALELTRTADNTLAYNVYLDTVDVEPDDSWRFSIWYRTTGNPDFDSSSWFTRLQLRDQDNNTVIYGSMLEVTEDYMRAVVTYQVPEGVTQLRPNLFLSWRDTDSSLIIDDIAFQEVGAAAEALRLAEVARQQAEAAHIAAGNAVDTAANAYDAASAKNTIHWSLSAPSGTADSTDDVWWQYELRNGRRVVVGQWFWDNGVWRETEIAEEWLPLVNIGTGTYGDLHGDRLTANTVHANKMLVGPRNIITDLGFSQFDAGSIEDGWGSYTGGWERVTMSWSDQQSHFASIISGHESDSGLKALHYGGSGPSSASLPCEPGERFKVRFQIVQYIGFSNDDDYRAQFRWVDANGSGIGWSVFQFGGEGYGNRSWAEFEALAPEGATRFYFRFAKYGVAAGRRGVGNLSIQSMTGSDLIVQGAVKSHSVDTEEFFAAQAVIEKIWTDIVRSRLVQSEGIITEDMIATGAITTPKLVSEAVKAHHLDAEEIFFDQAIGNTVAAGVGEFLELNADQIRSNSWTGITATGATFQTHTASNRGIKLQPQGIRGWDSNGNQRFDLSATTGNMTATGTFRTAFSGNRAELDPDTFGGKLSFYRGSHIGTLKLNDSLDRLEMVYGVGSSSNQERPNIGVEETRAIVGYRQTQIIVGGTTVDNQGITVNGVFRGDVGYRGMIQMEAGARVRYYDNNNRYLATVGQSPGAGSSSMFQIWVERGSLNVVNGGLQIPENYKTTSSTSANVYISSSGWLSRATSASRYKLDQQELTVPDSVLDVPMVDWVDKAATEFKAEMDAKPRPFNENDQKQYDTIDLRRIPGVVAETVEAYGGEQFVTYGPDGQIEEVMYDRLALAQIQVLKRRIEALEGAS